MIIRIVFSHPLEYYKKALSGHDGMGVSLFLSGRGVVYPRSKADRNCLATGRVGSPEASA